MIVYKHVLIGVIVKNCGKYLDNLARQILKTDYPKTCLSVAFLENDSDDNSWDIITGRIAPLLKSYRFCDVYAVKKDFGYKLKHTSRHIKSEQKKRWACIAKARQFIVDTYLRDIEYIWWVDADLEIIPSGTLETLLSYDKDCISPIYKTRDGKLYDSSSRMDNMPIKELLNKSDGIRPIEINETNCQALMHKRVFKKGANFYIEGEENSNLIQSRRMKKMGIKFFLTPRVVVTHQTICGTKPL